MKKAVTTSFLALGAFVLLALCSGNPASAGDGMVALRTCDASCPQDGTDFFVACNNGTVTDNRTGLVWLANADCFGELDWNEAMVVVAGLGDLPGSACAGMHPDECDCGLSDHSSPGEWRLPSMAEWKAMISSGWGQDTCSPTIANDVGNDCWDQACVDAAMCSLREVQASLYWSSSSYVSDPAYAWLGDLALGGVDMLPRDSYAHVWPVRGGQ